MTHTRDVMQKEGVLKSILAQLDDKGKDSALAILRALSFAQTAMDPKTGRTAEQEKYRQPARTE